jgi:hypothetical protein
MNGRLSLIGWLTLNIDQFACYSRRNIIQFRKAPLTLVAVHTTYTPDVVRKSLQHFECDLKAGKLPGSCTPDPWRIRGIRESHDAYYVPAAAIVADLKRGLAGLSHGQRLGIAAIVSPEPGLRGPVQSVI